MRCLHGRAGVDFFVVDLLVAAAALEQVVERRHDADADGVVVLRDVPAPALLVRRLDDERGPLVPAGVAVGALASRSRWRPCSAPGPTAAA